MIGPVYVAHRYSAPTLAERQRNLEDAAQLSSDLNGCGIATVSPLQESRGRSSALPEDRWLAHGLVLLRACVAIVYPWRQVRASAGLRAELEAARVAGIPSIAVERDQLDGWHITPELVSAVIAACRARQ